MLEVDEYGFLTSDGYFMACLINPELPDWIKVVMNWKDKTFDVSNISERVIDSELSFVGLFVGYTDFEGFPVGDQELSIIISRQAYEYSSYDFDIYGYPRTMDSIRYTPFNIYSLRAQFATINIADMITVDEISRIEDICEKDDIDILTYGETKFKLKQGTFILYKGKHSDVIDLYHNKIRNVDNA